MAGRELRTIKVGTHVYYWRTHHRHNANTPAGERRCTEVFTAFQENYRRQPVRILFPEGEKQGPGFPSQRGVVVDYRDPQIYINLNRPRIARLLIELAIASGWEPATSHGEFVIADGYQLLRDHRAELDIALGDDSRDAKS